MTDARDQFAELARRGHEVFTAAVQAWEQAARSLAETARRPGGRLPDIRGSVDAAFDFAAQMLADQRDFTKTVMSVGSQVIAATAHRAEPAAEPSGEPAAGPEAVTGSELRSAPEPVPPALESQPRESQPRAVASEGPSDTAETVTQPDTAGTDAVVAPEWQPDTGEKATAEPVGQPDTGGTDAAASVEQPSTPEPVEQPSTPEPDAAAAAPAPAPDDSAGAATPETKGPAPAAVARKAAAKRTTAAKKTTTEAAKKTATPAAKKAAAAAKKTAAPAKRTGPAKRTAGPRGGESS
jgi:hypothetical protein